MSAGRPHRPPGDRARRFDPDQWEALGISRREGERWHGQRIEPPDALRWRRAGVCEPIDATRWKIAGVAPRTVREWRYAEIDAGEAVVWAELGFNASQARKHKRAGRSPAQAHEQAHGVALPLALPQPPSALGTPGAGQVSAMTWSGGQMVGQGPPVHPAHRFMMAVRRAAPGMRHHVIPGYMQRQWFDDEAIAWASEGIDAAEALCWKELGLGPAEAARQCEAGLSAMQAARAWWDAGIPSAEVAEWVGAGLTPAEAAQQRAAGVTVEQVAVLRSLRAGGEPPSGR